MSDDESQEVTRHGEVDEHEAQHAMEEAARKKAEKMRLEMEEYEESRREAREKEAEEIESLRRKREERKKEREEEEIRLAERRREEDARRKAEEEERKRKKAEDEARRKAERAAKLKELEEKKKLAKVPNFVIVKKEGGEAEEDPKESAQKTKEQLEEEKRAVLAQRIIPLSVDGLDAAALAEKAKELHAKLLSLANQKYELEELYKRQQYDMIELAERARQMKGNKKRGMAAQVDESFDRLADKFPGAPPKIQLCSKYERHTDQRTYGQRLNLFEELGKEPLAPEIKRKDAAGAEDGGEEATNGPTEDDE